MNKMHNYRGLTLLYALIFSACMQGYVTQVEFKKYMEQEANTRKSIDQYLQGLYAYVSNRECPADLITVLETIRKGCGVEDTTPSGRPTNPKSQRLGVCSVEEFRDAVAEYERVNKQPNSFFRKLWDLQHEVFYLGNLMGLDTLRQDRMERFASMHPFPDTQYFVITSPKRGEQPAEQRASWITEQLVSRGIPRSKIPKPLTSYDFFSKLKKTELPQADRHIDGSPEPDDIHQSVWVFRANCVKSE